MDEYHKVMTENLAERFVDHRNISLAPQTIAELALHHRKCGLHITPLVVMLQEFAASKLKIVVHLFPRPSTYASVRRTERNERRCSKGRDSIGVGLAGIALVGGDFRDLEVLSCAL